MRISVAFKNLDSSEHIKSYLQEKIDRFDKLLDQPGSAHVVLRAEKTRRIAEINLQVGRFDIHAKEENTEIHAAIDIALEKIKKQINKSKEKMQERRTRARGKTAPDGNAEIPDDGDLQVA